MLSPITVFPCYAPGDRALADEVSAFLERGGPVRAFLEDGEIRPGETLPRRAAEGFAADVILLLLSPASTPVQWPRAVWGPLLPDAREEGAADVASFLAAECAFPALLRRRNFFDATASRLEAMRRLKAWILACRPPAREPVFEPGGPPGFRGRERELEHLAVEAADRPGVVTITGPEAAGKTWLALEFARRNRGAFETVCWVGCAGRTTVEIAGESGAQLGLQLPHELEGNLAVLGRTLEERRCLIVLDDAPCGCEEIFASKCSSLVATRTGEGGLEPMAAPEAAIAEEDLPAVRAACACPPGGFGPDLLRKLSGASAGDLHARGLLMLMNDAGPLYVVPPEVRRRAGPPDMRRFAEVVSREVAWGKPACETGLAAAQHAFRWALANDQAWPLACELARRIRTVGLAQERNAEVYEAMLDLVAPAHARGDFRMWEESARERVWLLKGWGRDEDAMELESEIAASIAEQMSFDFDALLQ